MKRKVFWTDKQNEIVKQYILTHDEKYITQLIPSLEKLASSLMYKLGEKETDDNIQDSLILMITDILPRITLDKYDTSYNFFFIGLKWNRMIEYRKNNLKGIKINGDSLDDYLNIYNHNDDADENLRIQELRDEINNAFDNKINALKRSSKEYKGRITFLEYVKNYAIDNSYDMRGCKEHIIKKMLITNQYFYELCKITNIDSQVLGEKLLK